MRKRLAVWIDHHEARVFHLDSKKQKASSAPVVTLHADPPKTEQGDEQQRRRPGAKTTRRFFKKLGGALPGKGDILLVGPATTKLAFLRFVHKYERKVDERIVGIETVERPTEEGFLTYARKYFEPRAPG